jgi:hypothetical protein
MRRLALVILLGAAACHPSEKPVADTPATAHAREASAACEKDPNAPVSKVPYCLSPELQAETLHHLVAAWCGQAGATVPRAECGAYTVISRRGDPSAPLHGSESLYFDRAGHLVGRGSFSDEWGPRSEGVVPNCTFGPETNACATGK